MTDESNIQISGLSKGLPHRSKGYSQTIIIGESSNAPSLTLTTSEYEDGTLGAISIEFRKEGALDRALIKALARSVSIGLQHGVPLAEYVEAFTFTRFQPNGEVTSHGRITNCTSCIDAIFRDLAIEYLGREDLAHIK